MRMPHARMCDTLRHLVRAIGHACGSSMRACGLYVCVCVSWRGRYCLFLCLSLCPSVVSLYVFCVCVLFFPNWRDCRPLLLNLGLRLSRVSIGCKLGHVFVCMSFLARKHMLSRWHSSFRAWL